MRSYILDTADYDRFGIFLSSNTQDFIEVSPTLRQASRHPSIFLSSNTQDFIEVGRADELERIIPIIPEL